MIYARRLERSAFITAGRIVLWYYDWIATPPLPPGATTTSRLQLIVCRQRNESREQAMSRALDAQWEHVADGVSIFGLQFPEGHSRGFALVVKFCTESCFDWSLMLLSYGDLWHIVTSMVRPLGFEILDTGLCLRIPVIADDTRQRPLRRALSRLGEDPYEWATTYLGGSSEVDTSRCLLRLSNDPGKVSSFLGLDWQKHQAGFMDETDACEWVTECRFFRRCLSTMNVQNPAEVPFPSSIFLGSAPNGFLRSHGMTHRWLPTKQSSFPWRSTTLASDMSTIG